MRLMDRIRHEVMFERVHHVAVHNVRYLQCLVEFVRMWHSFRENVCNNSKNVKKTYV